MAAVSEAIASKFEHFDRKLPVQEKNVKHKRLAQELFQKENEGRFILETDTSKMQRILVECVTPEKSQKAWQRIFAKTVQAGPLTVGKSYCQGPRMSMEDTHTVTQFDILCRGVTHQVQLLGVFDGHCGKEASDYVKFNIAAYLKEALEAANRDSITEEGVWDGLKLCHEMLHDGFTGEGGTTSLAALILQEKLWIANAGDCRILLCHNGKVIPLNFIADVETYRHTIEKKGGTIHPSLSEPHDPTLRVNGQLNVACGIGDKGVPGMSHTPKNIWMDMKDVAGGVLVLATDGLFESGSPAQIGKAVLQMMEQGVTPLDMAQRLTYSALAHDALDNVTVLVVSIPTL